MDTILSSVVPLFSIIFVGLVAGRCGVIDQAGIRTLVAFVFTFAMPALLFRMMATANIGEVDDWPVLLAYLAAQIPVFIIGLAMGCWLFRQSMADMTIQAFGSSFSNGVVLGLPLVLSLYGEQAGVPALLIITLDIILFSATTLLLEIATLRAGNETQPGLLLLMRKLAFSVGTHPLILASFLGLVVSLSPLALPNAVDGTLGFLGQAGPPAGLFALGATLGQSRITGQWHPAAVMIAMKLVLHPLLAGFMAFFVFTLDPIAAGVVLLFAACPVGANVYIFAAQYNAGAGMSATAILISTGISLFSLSLLASLLVGG